MYMKSLLHEYMDLAWVGKRFGIQRSVIWLQESKGIKFNYSLGTLGESFRLYCSIDKNSSCYLSNGATMETIISLIRNLERDTCQNFSW